MALESDDDNFDIELPFGPPPILPNVKKQLTDHILCLDNLPIHNFEYSQQYWPREVNSNHLLNFTNAPLATKLKVERDLTTGKLLQFHEVAVKNSGNTAKNSMSLNRAPGLFSEGIRGSPSNYPFWPGGFPDLEENKNTSNAHEKIDFEKDLLSIPPGFSRGMEFLADGSTPISATGASKRKNVKNENTPVVNLMNVLQEEQALMDNWKDGLKKEDKDKDDKDIDSSTSRFDLDPDISLDITKSDNIPIINITDPPKKRQIFQWAEEVDVSSPLHNFKDLVPDPAYTWPFELDTFQKQAIIKLEKGDNVFVAAHTSAGKTVVAEYAIALSCKNLTRTIYTSPIKALSNQKFRDFKETFKTILKEPEKEVGLVTGDYQINQNGSCLIMTTEILLQMLYCGSPIMPDLEFVIFDEVHYINDSERGHVWEEVLILLPDHVKIVMLSATVPNTLEFANWVGQTKKRKMYVITTPKRPVPLEHYLYVGSVGKHRQKRFLILDADSRFQSQGYYDAKDLIEGNKPQHHNFSSAKQDKTLWIDFIDHLRKEERLPVVAFTLNKNRCNKNAAALSSIDFTTAKEKSSIHHFYENCIKRLKEADQLIPQVIQMRDLLKRGIGIHHSGILPILKEIVEMLFQKGFVKLLFATETFAMGVNMPARTVVFDSIRKYDGSDNRTLNPSEYIQMAGRAGRRGLDTTGTVILLCKHRVPDLFELKNMILGIPSLLTSQFRLSYSMILSLLRVEKISVEGMMTHSFKEVHHFSSQDSHKKKQLDIEYQITMSDRNRIHGPHVDAMENFYRTADEYLKIWRKLRPIMLAQISTAKLLVPGSIILVTSGNHLNKLGLLLSCDIKSKEPIFKVLVLCNLEANKDPSSENKSDDWYKMLALASWREIFVPEGIGGHTVLNIKYADIFEILNMRPLKINCETILRDWDNRQIPRFRDNPPGQSCSSAIQEITQLTMKISENVPNWAVLSKDLPLEYIELLDSLTILRNQLIQSSCIKMANFNKQFEEVFNHMELLKQKENLQYLQSDKALTLYSDYENRIKVLQHLKYITKNNTVELKGQVACNIRRHELIITELVFGDILTNLEPAEIAALLSCLVFKDNTNNEPILPESMNKPREAITKVAEEIVKAEKLYKVAQVPGDEKEIKFGLAQIVYAWAQNEPFSKIMTITDVHEGLIVRCMQQLHETLKDVKEAARHIGNPTVEQKMEHAATMIKRDIIFAPSLYTLQLPQINTQ